jgi:serine/threonine-protein kinase RsbW
LKIEEAPFINRQYELAFFKQKALEIAQGRGEDLFFISPQGRGKTALLKELKEILFWGGEGLIPVYFSFSRVYSDLLDFAEDYLVSLLSQILLFEQKDLLATQKEVPLSFSGLQREAEKQGKGIIEEVILSHQKYCRSRDERKGFMNALTAPRRIGQAVNKPIWMLVDHIQGLEAFSITWKGALGMWREVIASPWAPHLFSGEPPGFLLKTILPALGSPNMAVMELTPLPAEEGKELAFVLERFFNIEITRDLIKTWVLYLECNPGTLTLLLREARLEAAGLESHQRFVEIYLKSLWQGELGRWYENRLYEWDGVDLLNGSYLLRILSHLLKSEGPLLAVTDLLQAMELPLKRIQPLIRILERAGVVWERFGNIGLENSRVMRDWVEVLVRKYLNQQDLGQVITEWGKEIERALSKLEEEKQVSLPKSENILHFSLVLPINSESELVAVRALEQMATYSDLDETSIEKVKIALIEACINASEHSQSFEKKIRVYFTVQPERIEIVVEDRGQAFDPVEVQARIVREADPLSQKRGRGLGLIREMMDEVRFEKADIGTRLYMVKKKFDERV